MLKQTWIDIQGVSLQYSLYCDLWSQSKFKAKVNQKISEKVNYQLNQLLLAHMAFKKSPKIPLHSTTNH